MKVIRKNCSKWHFDENYRYFTHKLYNTCYYFTLVKVKFKEKKWFKLKINYAGWLP